MGNKNKQQQSSDLDFFSPFVEILSEIINALILLLGALITWSLKRGHQWYLENKKGVYANSPLKNRQLESKKTAFLSQTLGYSINRKRDFNFAELDTKRHTAIIGSTGSGKSVCMENLMIRALIQHRPVIYFDPKPSIESIKRFKKLCAYFERTSYIVSNLDLNARFNPLIDGNAHEITSRIMNALEWSESYYKNESQRVLFETVMQLERNQASVTIQGIVELLESYHDRKTISGLYSQLIALNRSEYHDMMNVKNSETLSFRKVRIEKSCVYIGISSLGMGSIGLAINKLYFGGILNHSKEAFNGLIPGILDPLESPIAIFFDELASTVHDGFIDLQNKCRAAGIELTFATQCPADLDRVSPEFTRQVFENTSNYFVFNQLVPVHTEFFARLAGTTTTLKKTYALEEDKRSDRGTEREVEEFIAHANIFRGLKVGQCVFIQRTPKRVDLININNRREFNLVQVTPTNQKAAISIFNQ